MFNPEPIRNLPDDGLYLPTIKQHSIEKIRAHNYSVQMFATAMKTKWPQRAYIGLYSGAGRARLADTGEIVETAATSVFRLPSPFTHYLFVDKDPSCTAALESRIRMLAPRAPFTVLTGDVNELAGDVLASLPEYSSGRGLLSYCFVDPFDAGLKFSTIRALSSHRMDFLVLLMLGWDARTNFKTYLDDESNTRIAELIDAPTWRAEWRRVETAGRANVIRFLMSKFDEAMVRIGYRSDGIEDAVPVKVHDKGVLIYMLVYYSKHPLGQEFWKATAVGLQSQLNLGF